MVGRFLRRGRGSESLWRFGGLDDFWGATSRKGLATDLGVVASALGSNFPGLRGLVGLRIHGAASSEDELDSSKSDSRVMRSVSAMIKSLKKKGDDRIYNCVSSLTERKTRVKRAEQAEETSRGVGTT